MQYYTKLNAGSQQKIKVPICLHANLWCNHTQKTVHFLSPPLKKTIVKQKRATKMIGGQKNAVIGKCYNIWGLTAQQEKVIKGGDMMEVYKTMGKCGEDWQGKIVSSLLHHTKTWDQPIKVNRDSAQTKGISSSRSTVN